MAKKYNQGAVSVSSARFTKAPMGELEFSRMYAEPSHTTTFNAGDIVPVYCGEVLPHGTYSMDVDSVIRQATLKVPSMDRAIIDIFAYFVPNRVVNKSWKNVMGENTSGSWQAPKVALATLCGTGDTSFVQNEIPVGSVADYYGFPTQQAIPYEVLQSCHDLKFRGYLEIYNNYFRDQNYQPPIAYSKLNVYEGFLYKNTYDAISWDGAYEVSDGRVLLESSTVPDGSVGAGAIAKELLGSGESGFHGSAQVPMRSTDWRAWYAPLKANKLHDYFTSVLPSPQKGEQVIIGIGETAPVITSSEEHTFDSVNSNAVALKFRTTTGDVPAFYSLGVGDGDLQNSSTVPNWSSSADKYLVPSNLYADLSQATGVPVSELRDSVAVQQVYEILGRGGSRYTEYINSFFELDIDNPFDDIPTCLGHIRRNLDLYQTAQTSASTDDSAQGNLSAFGYTSTGGKLFTRTFLEHGYIHVLAVVRHKNIYPAMLSRDNFRLSMMDFYQYPLANISEQPVYAREINPYAGNDQVFGYQEAWAEYRTEPDRVSGLMRTGTQGAIDQWTYADPFDADLLYADGNFMESNSEEVIARGTAFLPTEDPNNTPQFKAKFTFKITKELPMPTYSMAGLDIL